MYEDDDAEGVKLMTIQLLELLATLLTKRTVHAIIKEGLRPFLSSISYYLFLTHEDKYQYLTDPSFFMSHIDEEENMNTIRYKCLKVILVSLFYF